MSLNKVLLIGNLGKDPEYKEIQDTHLCKFSLATTEKYNGKEYTEWHNIILWGKLAELAAKYLTKGSQVYIEGKNKTRNYEKDGLVHYRTEVEGREMRFLGRKEKKEDVETDSGTGDLPF